jgi:hypothetical protein
MNPVSMFRPKIIHFNQVNFSKISFPIPLGGDEEVFKQNESSFEGPAKKFHVPIKFADDITLRSYDKLILR